MGKIIRIRALDGKDYTVFTDHIIALSSSNTGAIIHFGTERFPGLETNYSQEELIEMIFQHEK